MPMPTRPCPHAPMPTRPCVRRLRSMPRACEQALDDGKALQQRLEALQSTADASAKEGERLTAALADKTAELAALVTLSLTSPYPSPLLLTSTPQPHPSFHLRPYPYPGAHAWPHPSPSPSPSPQAESEGEARARLSAQLDAKQAELDALVASEAARREQLGRAHQEAHDGVTAELGASQARAAELDAEVAALHERIAALQRELKAEKEKRLAPPPEDDKKKKGTSILGRIDIDEGPDAPPVTEQIANALRNNSARVLDLFREWDADGDGEVPRKRAPHVSESPYARASPHVHGTRTACAHRSRARSSARPCPRSGSRCPRRTSTRSSTRGTRTAAARSTLRSCRRSCARRPRIPRRQRAWARPRRR